MATNFASILNTILQGVLAAVSAAPQVQAVIAGAKGIISGLVEAKMITVEQQDALHGWVDTQAKLAAVGITAPAWTVEPDPTPAPISPPPVA